MKYILKYFCLCSHLLYIQLLITLSVILMPLEQNVKKPYIVYYHKLIFAPVLLKFLQNFLLMDTFNIYTIFLQFVPKLMEAEKIFFKKKSK